MSLPSLRKAIVELDTFFDVDPMADLEKTSKESKRKARPSHNHRSVKTSPRNAPKTLKISDDSSVFLSPVVDQLHPHSGPAPKHITFKVQSIESDFIIGDSGESLAPASSGLLSAPESKGPITPDTIAVDPSVAVSDIAEEEGLGQPLKLPTSTFISKFKPSTVKSKRSKGGQFFRSAIQRLKGFSGSTSV